MFSISAHAYSALTESARHTFVHNLAQELRERFPERFYRFSPVDMVNYVESRIAYAAQHGLTRQDCVAELANVECQCMADFVRDHDQGWWADILAEDAPQDHKVRALVSLVDHIEVAPGFVPVFD